MDIVKRLLNVLFTWFQKKPIQNQPMNIDEGKKMSEIITLDDLLTSSGKYPERKDSPECTEEVKTNAKELLSKLNQLLMEINIKECKVSSGFRTQAANDVTKNSAKKSKHMTGNAIDIQELDGSLKKLVTEDLLEKHGLYCEHFDYTKTWIHFQDISPKSGRRFFIP